MKPFVILVWLLACPCVFAGTTSSPSPSKSRDLWNIKMESRPVEHHPLPLTLANNDPETIKCEQTLRRMRIKHVDVDSTSVETVLDALAKAVADSYPTQPKMRFVTQTKEAHELVLSLSDIALSEALSYLAALANVEFVVDRNTIFVKAKPKKNQ